MLFSTSLVIGDEMKYRPDKQTIKIIKIEKYEGLHVNEQCLLDKKKCIKLFDGNKIYKLQTANNPKEFAGNQASDFCRSIKGSPVILEDKKNNEYDYCKFQNKYFVDAWDLFKMYQK